MVLGEFLPAWMAARKIAMTDPEYNKAISRVIAQQAEIVLKAAQEMAESADDPNGPLMQTFSPD